MSAQERAPLLEEGRTPQRIDVPNEEQVEQGVNREKTKAYLASSYVFVFIFAIVIAAVIIGDNLPKDPMKAAIAVLERSPVIVAVSINNPPALNNHLKDLPILVRWRYLNNVSDINLNGKIPGHVDIPRLRRGHVGAFFWSVFTPCEESGSDFVNPTNSVRDTLEQIDVATLMMERYHETFELAVDISQARDTMRRGKIAGLIGVEGAHQIGNSLGTLRMFQKLGIKYLTLTHICHNAFADSAGSGAPLPSRHGGLSSFGRTLIKELNRLGVLIDLSHTSDQTARQALMLSEAPVIWSHSSARSIWNHPRNVPDDILKMIGEGKGKKDAVVMVNFYPEFVAAEGNATVQVVADHIEHIAKVSGRQHVGIGSDFDGIDSVPRGLEDVSKYPNLFAELRRRQWSRRDLTGLAGGNLLRVLENAESFARQQAFQEGNGPYFDIYKKRPDLPMHQVAKGKEDEL